MPSPRPDLASVRRARGYSQTDVARALKTAQADISKLEHRDDPRLSTLIRYVEVLGGELELVASFKDERVKIAYRSTSGRARREG